MSNMLKDAIAESLNNKKPLIWLDAEQFASSVLLKGKPFPWTRPTEFVSTYSQMQKLLTPGIAPVDIGRFLGAWLVENKGVLSEMRGKKRIRFALKKLLSMGEQRELIRDIVSALCQTVSEPVVLVLPPNGDLINWANQVANGAEPAEIDEMDIDSVSVYIADFLRTFNSLDIAGVVVQLPDQLEITPEYLDLYSPIRNLAKHYQWGFGVMARNPSSFSCDDENMDFIVSDHGRADVAMLEDDFWETGRHHANTHGFYAEVPKNLTSDLVLERIGMLKRSGS